ncbi:cAMP-binding protein [Bernardetia litoralis DSM 6794]|uniref:cAMP-binding protein n=1 Tax=Bernardetia litoralis (strain ATCC 23117 / DSM 6794 / NBRC 15988 / NCIMB 1366 / Fx l1 / Sio-4) TaxID=880071 RepID=I4AML1_BERLS|nr:Crp/Fnr family transcriptional regulator [Bernardetia litoralis]AFM05196.1 cAMP-binding protein [Bernardetia litoralis DSM 6794]
MDDFIDYINLHILLSKKDIDLLKNVVTTIELPAHKVFIEAGTIDDHLYFLCCGIIKGYKNKDGKIVIEHLVDENNFFAAMESFMNQIPSLDSYETITNSKICKISRDNFKLLRDSITEWNNFIEIIYTQYLQCKTNRVQDFQLLTAKERYIKFVEQYPNLALNVSVENMASFLGIEPQSLSRIRKQITI